MWRIQMVHFASHILKNLYYWIHIFQVVPFGADNDQIIKTAKFRTKERLPILVYAQVLNEKKTV